MKKIAALLGMSLLLASNAQAMMDYPDTTDTGSMMPMATTTANDDGMMHMVKAHMLNVRDGASVSNHVADVLHEGDTVKVTEKTKNMRWCHVSSDALTASGWVYCDYLSKDTPVTAMSLTHTMTATRALNVRSNPGMGNNLIDHLDMGDTVTVVNHPDNGRWCKIQLKDYKKAYVACQYLK